MKKKFPRILFICKKRLSTYKDSFGLINSAKFTAKALQEAGVADTKVVTVIDNNFIDRKMKEYKPSHVVIEALWVVPEKFLILMEIYPDIIWTVRIHSNIPFLGHEGIAIQWLKEYGYLGEHFIISGNSLRFIDCIEEIINGKVDYLPNIYPNKEEMCRKKEDGWIDIGCFGSIRPLKNQLIQAIAAIHMAEKIGKRLRFHINGNRIEQQGEPILKNIRNLFKYSKHELIEHDWMVHDNFIELVKTMDIGMQVSFSETFNIVTADFVACGKPIVVSKEIEWVSGLFKVDNPTDVEDIKEKLGFVYKLNKLEKGKINRWWLDYYNKCAIKAWKKSRFLNL